MIDRIKYNPKQLLGLEYLSNKLKKFYLFWGGSRSGKTYLTIRAIRIRALKYPGSKHLVARYSFANAKKTIWLQTMIPEFKKDEKLGLCRILKNEGIINYTNGSMVRLGGLEPSTIDSVLSSEYGTIFINEANENKYDTMETLISRLNDTAKDDTGNSIPLKFICDLNPTVERHWANILFIKGIDPESMESKQDFHLYTHLHFSPEDNELNLADGYIDTLKNLSRAKRKRFYEGKFGSYEGLVFNIDEDTHVVDDFPIPEKWEKYRGIDFGYTHPFVCLWAAYDSANDCVYFYREHVRTQITVFNHAKFIKALSKKDLSNHNLSDVESEYALTKLYTDTVADHDAEDRATLAENGIKTNPANKEVLAGIDHVIDLLDWEDGRRTRVKIFRSLTNLRGSLDTYRWKETNMAGTKAKDREVIKEDDDEADAFRYLLMRIFPIKQRKNNKLNLGSGWRK